MKPVIFTIIGNDKPGLVDILAKTVYANEGNWQGSSFAHMAGQFAGFVEVLVPEDKHQTLENALNQIDGLHVQVQSAPERTMSKLNKVTIDVTGNDRTGIVQEITNILNGFNLNILNFSSRCESAPNWGGLIFKANLHVEVPTDTHVDELQDALEAVANDLIVDMSAED